MNPDYEEYYFNPNQFKVVRGEEGVEGNRLVPNCMDDKEKHVRSIKNEEGKSVGVIMQCTIVGPSINRIIEPGPENRIPGVGYGLNHVLTPVKVEKIYYIGEGSSIQENEVYYLLEPYFYINESAHPYCDYYEVGSVYAEEYYPMQEGYHYLVYASNLVSV